MWVLCCKNKGIKTNGRGGDLTKAVALAYVHGAHQVLLARSAVLESESTATAITIHFRFSVEPAPCNCILLLLEYFERPLQINALILLLLLLLQKTAEKHFVRFFQG